MEPFGELYRGSASLERIRKVYDDISDIPKGNRYGRITSVAAFEHILNLPEVVANAALLLADNGSLRVSIPNEGTILWKPGTVLTGYEFKRMYGLALVLAEFRKVNRKVPQNYRLLTILTIPYFNETILKLMRSPSFIFVNFK